MNFGAMRECDIANGTGCRVSLFVSGCPHHCKGCFNAESWDYDFGRIFTPEELGKLITACDKPWIEGLSILGGEPMDPKNQWAVLGIILDFRTYFHDTKNIWLWTGYHYNDLLAEDKLYGLERGKANVPGCTMEILKNIDVLVDGPFIEEQKDISLKFRGSKNQRVLHLLKDSFLIDYSKGTEG